MGGSPFEVIRPFLLIGKRFPKPLPRGIFHSTAARFLQNPSMQDPAFFGFYDYYSFAGFYKSAAGAQPQKSCFCDYRGLGMLPQKAQVSGHLPCLLLLSTSASLSFGFLTCLDFLLRGFDAFEIRFLHRRQHLFLAFAIFHPGFLQGVCVGHRSRVPKNCMVISLMVA